MSSAAVTTSAVTGRSDRSKRSRPMWTGSASTLTMSSAPKLASELLARSVVSVVTPAKSVPGRSPKLAVCSGAASGSSGAASGSSASGSSSSSGGSGAASGSPPPLLPGGSHQPSTQEKPSGQLSEGSS